MILLTGGELEKENMKTADQFIVQGLGIPLRLERFHVVKWYSSWSLYD